MSSSDASESGIRVTAEESCDPVVPLLIDTLYSELCKQGTQRQIRERIIHPFLQHVLGLFGPAMSIIVSLLSLLIFLMITSIILLIWLIYISSRHIHGNPLAAIPV
jgi:hypothetical protein